MTCGGPVPAREWFPPEAGLYARMNGIDYEPEFRGSTATPPRGVHVGVLAVGEVRDLGEEQIEISAMVNRTDEWPDIIVGRVMDRVLT